MPHRILSRERHGYDGVAEFVIGNNAAFLGE